MTNKITVQTKDSPVVVGIILTWRNEQIILVHLISLEALWNGKFYAWEAR